MKQFRFYSTVFLAVGFLLTLSTICRSADAPTAVEQRHVTQLAIGDPVVVQVLGQPDATTVYVGDDGTISVPLVGNVQVAGMSPTEAATQIEKSLRDGGYFVDPHVTIVTPPRSQVVTVLGEVRSSGRFAINPGATILDVLAQAGGLKETASNVGYVLRKDSSGNVSRYPVNLNGLIDTKDAPPAPTLLGADTLVVPPAEHVFITGEVTTPGKYYIEPGMTVMQAIVRAGGITARGSEHRIELRRLGKDGQYQVLHAKSGDPIQAEDVIRVKESIF